MTAIHPAARLRLTRRGHRVLAALIALPLAAGLGAAVVGGGSALADRTGGTPGHSFRTVTVVPGDTLWGIAQRVLPRDDPRDVVDAIVRLNALPDVSITPGERLAVPAAADVGR